MYLRHGMWSVAIDARRELDPVVTERLVTLKIKEQVNGIKEKISNMKDVFTFVGVK